jgi:ankyrin repeat protein
MSKRLLTPTIALLVLLLSAGCDRRIDVDLNYALEQGDFEWAGELLERGADIDARFILARGNTNLIMLARLEGHEDGLRFLIDQGADLNVQNFDGRTALFAAAHEGRLPHVQALIAAGADPNVRNKSGLTALHTARNQGHVDVERAIREAGGTD